MVARFGAFMRRHRLPVLISATARQRLRDRPDELNALLATEFSLFERAYRQGESPVAVAEAARRLAVAMEGVPPTANQHYGRLLGLVGRMLVAAGGDKASMQLAARFLDRARRQFEDVDAWNATAVRDYVDLALNHAIALKALGQRSEAIEILHLTRSSRLQRYAEPWHFQPLERQEMIMAASTLSHRRLAEQANLYRGADPLEYYRSVKRVFEFVLNQHSPSAARLYPLFVQAFAPVAETVPPIARISFLKDCGQYLALTKEPAAAVAALNLARSAAQERGLLGQVRQADQMIEAVEGGELPVLNTFTAP